MIGAYPVTIFRVAADGTRTHDRSVMTYCADCFFNTHGGERCPAPTFLPPPRSTRIPPPPEPYHEWRFMSCVGAGGRVLVLVFACACGATYSTDVRWA